MAQLFTRVTIVGVGLIGGSLGLAAKAAGLVGEVVGFGRSAANLHTARERGAIDRIATTAAEATRDSDAIVLAAPVGACAGLAREFSSSARPGTLLTDAASVKGALVPTFEAAWAAVGPVVGAHPIAGSEASGAAAARGDLFRDRRCVLTPTATTAPTALARVRALWEGVGMVVEEMTPDEHDAVLGRISHLPHLIAYALVNAAGGARVGGRNVLDYAGGGFLDTTRIAASRPELWRDILLANRDALALSLREFRAALDRLSDLIARGDGAALEAALAEAEQLRRRLNGGR